MLNQSIIEIMKSSEYGSKGLTIGEYSLIMRLDYRQGVPTFYESLSLSERQDLMEEIKSLIHRRDYHMNFLILSGFYDESGIKKRVVTKISNSKKCGEILGISRTIKNIKKGSELEEKHSWQASWVEEGKQRSTSFSINKHGEDEALRRAEYCYNNKSNYNEVYP